MAPDINAEIAERIMGWEVDRKERLYRHPQRQQGVFEGLPDFLQRDHESLRQTMKSRGYKLTVTEKPLNLKENIGRMFTARYSHQNGSFQTTQPDERLAVCVAALKAYGFPISDDQ